MSMDLKIAASEILAWHGHTHNNPLESEEMASDSRFLISSHSQQNKEKRQSASFSTMNIMNSSNTNNQHAYDLQASKYRHNGRKTDDIDTHHFLVVLMNLLMDVIHKDKLSFLPDGKSIIINRFSFSCSLMPRYFNISNFALFIRALKRMGFVQVMKHAISDSCVIFYHPSFCNSQKEVLRKDSYLPFRKTLERKRIIEAKETLRHDQSSSNLRHASNTLYLKKQKRKQLALRDDIDSVSLRLLSRIRKTTVSAAALSRHREYRCVHSTKKDVAGAYDVNHQQNLYHITNAKNSNPIELSQLKGSHMIQDLTNEVVAGCDTMKDVVGTCDLNHQQNLYHIINAENSNPAALSQLEGFRTIEDFTNDVVAAGVQCLLHDENHTIDLLARRGHELKNLHA